MSNTLYSPKILFTRDSSGGVRQWWAEIDGDKTRTCSGQVGGAIVESAWKQMKAKNEGKKNYVSPHEQAIKEVESLIKKQLKQGYWERIEDIDNQMYIRPMLAKKLFEHPFSFPAYSQPKFDGVRCTVSAMGAYSREGEKFVTVPHLEDLIMPILEKSKYYRAFDGELYNHKFKEDFNAIISLIKKKAPSPAHLDKTFGLVEHHTYDLVPHEQYMDIPYEERYAALAEMVALIDHPAVVLARNDEVHNMEEVHALHEEYIELGYEGQMIRVKGSKYKIDGRSADLLKHKTWIDEEYEILDIIEGEGNKAGYAAATLHRNAEGKEFNSGMMGDRKYCKEVLQNKDQYIGGQATVKYFRLTPAGVPRFPKTKVMFAGKRNM